MTKMLALAGLVTVMSLGAGNVLAQGRGNFDPAQFRQNRLDRYKEQMGVTDDAEWKVLETSIGKVMDAQQEVGGGPVWRFRAAAVVAAAACGQQRWRGTSSTNSASVVNGRWWSRRFRRHSEPGSRGAPNGH